MTWAGWNATNIAELKRLRAEGKSGAEISRALGCSRNAAVAKAERLGLPIPPRQPPPKAPPRAKPLRSDIATAFVGNPNPVKRPEPIWEQTMPADADPVTLVYLKAHCCKWPLSGEGADTLFCAAPSGDAVYCATHAKRAYNRGASPLRAAEQGYVPGKRRAA